MKKFEALERVQQATAQQPAGGDGGATDGAGAGAGAAGMELLTEAQLQEVFKQTSVFTVKSATAGPESMYGHGTLRPSSIAAARSLGSGRPSCCARASLRAACAPDGHDDDDAYRSDEEWCVAALSALASRTQRACADACAFPAQGRGRVQRLRRRRGRRGRAGVTQAPRAGAKPPAAWGCFCARGSRGAHRSKHAVLLRRRASQSRRSTSSRPTTATTRCSCAARRRAAPFFVCDDAGLSTRACF